MAMIEAGAWSEYYWAEDCSKANESGHRKQINSPSGPTKKQDCEVRLFPPFSLLEYPFSPALYILQPVRKVFPDIDDLLLPRTAGLCDAFFPSSLRQLKTPRKNRSSAPPNPPTEREL
ncbi:reverse transcriptase [Aspergillus luchuensis]|uniref:Reverse transcriptase n=1 Tax=Aspergillus kawachii TaxID=1069201 RepID=A0A146FRM2_ASPKA|nr:reverse transcriptase [Aspergillus luchuensis]